MNPEQFMDVAERLRKGHHEADHRSCISRAYYAVYNLVRIAILQHVPLALRQTAGLGAKKRIPHDNLVTRLRASSDPQVKLFGEELGNLLNARHIADYELGILVSQKRAETAYAIADELRVELNAYGVVKLALVIKSDLESIHKRS